MSRKQILIIVIIFFLAVFGTLAYLYFAIINPKQPAQPGENGVNTFFPVGTSGGGSQAPSESIITDGTQITFFSNEIIPNLRQISEEPVAGFTVFDRLSTSSPFTVAASLQVGTSSASTTPAKRETVIRFAARANGHIYETITSSPSVIRLTNTTIPQVYSAHFGENPNNVLMQTLDQFLNIQTFAGSIVGTSTSENSFEGAYTSINTDSIAFSPSKREIASVIKAGGETTVRRSLINNASAQALFSSSVSDWEIQWPATSTIFLTTPADSSMPGFFYALNAVSGAFTKIFGDMPGLTTLVNPAGNRVLFGGSGSSAQSRSQVGTYNIDTEAVTVLNLQTLPEKCVWSKMNTSTVFCATPAALPAGEYPEDWYKGKVSFMDNVWKVDADTGVRQLAMGSDQQEGYQFDITKPMLSPDESFLFFINKNDLTLWMYDLTAAQ